MRANKEEPAAKPAAPMISVTTGWASPLRFQAGWGGTTVSIDCEGTTGPGPLDIVLQALSACAASDVVLILEKQRTPVATLTITASATRVPTSPRRFDRIHLAVRASGAGIKQNQLARAVALSLEKYCSVRESLNPSINVDWTAIVDGAADDPACA